MGIFDKAFVFIFTLNKEDSKADTYYIENRVQASILIILERYSLYSPKSK